MNYVLKLQEYCFVRVYEVLKFAKQKFFQENL